MTEPILVEKTLDGMKEGSKTRARLAAAEVGSTLTQLRSVMSRAECRHMQTRGTMRFDPPIPPVLRIDPPETHKRLCMCCRKPFMSQGNHHRLCLDCNKVGANMSPLEAY